MIFSSAIFYKNKKKLFSYKGNDAIIDYFCIMNVKISVIRKASYPDLSARYENPIEHTCDLCEGDVFISHDGLCPDGLCQSAWGSMKEFVEELARGGGNFYDGWMKDPHSAMISCNDGFRPVSFLLETID